MTSVKILRGEWYPIYSIEDYGDDAELTDTEIVQIKEAFAFFDDAQRILRAAWEKATSYPKS